MAGSVVPFKMAIATIESIAPQSMTIGQKSALPSRVNARRYEVTTLARAPWHQPGTGFEQAAEFNVRIGCRIGYLTPCPCELSTRETAVNTACAAFAVPLDSPP